MLASQNLQVSNKEKIMKDAFKTAARSIREESGQVSGQVLKFNWSSKRKSRKVGKAQRTAEV